MQISHKICKYDGKRLESRAKTLKDDEGGVKFPKPSQRWRERCKSYTKNTNLAIFEEYVRDSEMA